MQLFQLVSRAPACYKHSMLLLIFSFLSNVDWSSWFPKLLWIAMCAGLRSNYLKDAPHPSSVLGFHAAVGSLCCWGVPWRTSSPFPGYCLVKCTVAFISGRTAKGFISLPSISQAMILVYKQIATKLITCVNTGFRLTQWGTEVLAAKLFSVPSIFLVLDSAFFVHASSARHISDPQNTFLWWYILDVLCCSL